MVSETTIKAILGVTWLTPITFITLAETTEILKAILTLTSIGASASIIFKNYYDTKRNKNG